MKDVILAAMAIDAMKKPAPDYSARVRRTHLNDATVPVFCPTGQATLSRVEKARLRIFSLGEEAAVSNERTILLHHFVGWLELPIPRSAVE